MIVDRILVEGDRSLESDFVIANSFLYGYGVSRVFLDMSKIRAWRMVEFSVICNLAMQPYKKKPNNNGIVGLDNWFLLGRTISQLYKPYNRILGLSNS